MDDEHPLVGRAVGGGAGLRHSLYEEVNGAERLDGVCVERALLIASLLVLMKLKGDLRERNVAVNASSGRERLRVNRLERLLRVREPSVFLRKRRRGVVAQASVRLLERRVEASAAEVGVNGRVAAQELHDVLVVNRLERLIARARGGRRGCVGVLRLLLLHARACQQDGKEQE